MAAWGRASAAEALGEPHLVHLVRQAEEVPPVAARCEEGGEAAAGHGEKPLRAPPHHPHGGGRPGGPAVAGWTECGGGGGPAARRRGFLDWTASARRLFSNPPSPFNSFRATRLF